VKAASSAYEATAARSGQQAEADGCYDNEPRSPRKSSVDSIKDQKRSLSIPIPVADHEAFYRFLPYWLKQEYHRLPPTVGIVIASTMIHNRVPWECPFDHGSGVP